MEKFSVKENTKFFKFPSIGQIVDSPVFGDTLSKASVTPGKPGGYSKDPSLVVSLIRFTSCLFVCLCVRACNNITSHRIYACSGRKQRYVGANRNSGTACECSLKIVGIIRLG